jgi:hypothetical protein
MSGPVAPASGKPCRDDETHRLVDVPGGDEPGHSGHLGLVAAAAIWLGLRARGGDLGDLQVMAGEGEVENGKTLKPGRVSGISFITGAG